MTLPPSDECETQTLTQCLQSTLEKKSLVAYGPERTEVYDDALLHSNEPHFTAMQRVPP